jgi:hypothetical protein
LAFIAHSFPSLDDTLLQLSAQRTALQLSAQRTAHQKGIHKDRADEAKKGARLSVGTLPGVRHRPSSSDSLGAGIVVAVRTLSQRRGTLDRLTRCDINPPNKTGRHRLPYCGRRKG